MHLHRSLIYLTALTSTWVRAQNFTGSYASTVDVKNLSNWAPCAQKCYPLAFGPPVGCGSLSNTTCVCKNIATYQAIAPCLVATCSLDETNMNEAFTTILCGEPPNPAIKTINDAASASVVAAAASATPSNLGDPNDLSNYPLCAQRCYYQAVALAPLVDYGCDVTVYGKGFCLCQPPFRAVTSACQEITCNLREKLELQVFSQQVCGPYYEKNRTLASAVSSAISAATSAVIVATESKVPTNPAEYPPCAQACFDKYLPASGCGSLANRACICSNGGLTSTLARCEQACNDTEKGEIFALSLELCFVFGGPTLYSNASILSGNGSTSNTSISPPSPSPFTGQASPSMAGGFALSIMVTVGLLAVVVLGL